MLRRTTQGSPRVSPRVSQEAEGAGRRPGQEPLGTPRGSQSRGSRLRLAGINSGAPVVRFRALGWSGAGDGESVCENPLEGWSVGSGRESLLTVSGN